MTDTQIPTTTLYNGVEMPWLGLGVHRAGSDEEVVAECGIPREEIFLASKVWNTDQGYRLTFEVFESSL